MKHILSIALAVAALAVAAPAYAAGDAAAGKAKAGSCGMCHGPNGEGTQMAPKLAGGDQAKFIQAMKDYASGKRDNAMMKSAAGSLSADDLANLAAFYAASK